MLHRLQKGVDGVSQVCTVRDDLGDVEGQQLLVVGVHGRRGRGWHLNRGIVRLGHQQIIVAAELLRQRGSQFFSLLRYNLSRVEIYVVIILSGAAIVAAARGDDRRSLEEQCGISLHR